MRRWTSVYAGWVAILLLLASGPLWASDLLMVRSQLPFDQAEPRLKAAIQDQGYTLSQVAQIDIDLVSLGLTRGDYRALSYGRPDETGRLALAYPELAPFLPLNIVLFAERGDSLLVAVNPLYYQQFFTQPELAEIFERWNSDLQVILRAVRDTPPR